MSTFDTPAVRRGLDLLLAAHPHLELVRAWIPGRDQDPIPYAVASSWLMVELGQRGLGETDAYAIWPFAIWRSTGAVHRLDADGAVVDPAIEFSIRPS